MKKNERKVLRGKLLIAIKGVIKNNNDYLGAKSDKVVNKSIKKIVNNTFKKKKDVIVK